jgi:ligand-binding sensor domain-containing protein
MRKKRVIGFTLNIAGLLLMLVSLTTCEKPEYTLLDPASAGTWTLFNTVSGIPSNQIRDILLDKQNNMWVTFSGNGVGKYTDGTWTYYNTSNSSLLSNSVTALATISNGGMIIGTYYGLSFLSASGAWSSYKDPYVTTMPINAIKVASNGWIWVGTENLGFYVNTGSSGYIQILADGFENVNAIAEDASGNIYLGTDNGLLKWNGTSYFYYSYMDGLPDNDIVALFYDSQKRLWIGTNGGYAAAWLDNSGIHQLSLMNGNVGTFIRDIFEDRRGDIWFGTWWDGLIRYDGEIPHSYKEYNGFTEDDINAVGEDAEGNLWIGLYSKGLIKYILPLE